MKHSLFKLLLPFWVPSSEQHHLLRQGNQPRLILDSSLSYIQNVMVVQVEFSRKQALRWRLVGRKLMKACPSHL